MAVLVGGLLGVSVAAPSAGAAEPSEVAAPSAKLVPATGAHFGAFVSGRNGLNQYDTLTRFEASLGRKLAVVNKYHDWSDHDYGEERRLLDGGRIPLISWRATDAQNDPGRAKAIAAGRHDATIVATADAVKALAKPVMLRWQWEMDQPPGQRQYVGEPADYVAAWRRIHGVFRQRGVTNAVWVWAPTAGRFWSGRSSSFYPGAEYVDWVGASTVVGDKHQPFTDSFAAFYPWAAKQGKPMFAWIGVTEKPSDPAWKARWFAETAATLQAKMPGIKAFVYYHSVSPAGGTYWADSSSAAMSGFKKMGCLAYFDPAGVC